MGPESAYFLAVRGYAEIKKEFHELCVCAEREVNTVCAPSFHSKFNIVFGFLFTKWLSMQCFRCVATQTLTLLNELCILISFSVTAVT